MNYNSMSFKERRMKSEHGFPLRGLTDTEQLTIVLESKHLIKGIRPVHTIYLSFFLHGQNFWRIKFTPKNANAATGKTEEVKDVYFGDV